MVVKPAWQTWYYFAEGIIAWCMRVVLVCKPGQMEKSIGNDPAVFLSFRLLAYSVHLIGRQDIGESVFQLAARNVAEVAGVGVTLLVR